jgi:hypothetical protein
LELAAEADLGEILYAEAERMRQCSMRYVLVHLRGWTAGTVPPRLG